MLSAQKIIIKLLTILSVVGLSGFVYPSVERRT